MCLASPFPSAAPVFGCHQHKTHKLGNSYTCLLPSHLSRPPFTLKQTYCSLVDVTPTAHVAAVPLNHVFCWPAAAGCPSRWTCSSTVSLRRRRSPPLRRQQPTSAWSMVAPCLHPQQLTSGQHHHPQKTLVPLQHPASRLQQVGRRGEGLYYGPAHYGPAHGVRSAIALAFYLVWKSHTVGCVALW